MPINDWAQVFSGPLFRNRLDDDYLSNADDYLKEYHNALRQVGKTSPFWQYPMITKMDIIKLSRYQIVGNYTRYEEAVLNELKDAKLNIFAAIQDTAPTRKNFLIWAAPGSGKTYFAQQIAEYMADQCHYYELNLAKLNQNEMEAHLQSIADSPDPVLCLIDEIDSKPEESWPYELMLPFFDSSIDRDLPLVVIMAGSSGFSLTGMKERIASRPKGQDLLSRIPAENQFTIPPISFGDRILIILSQFVQAAQESGYTINSVEKLGFCTTWH